MTLAFLLLLAAAGCSPDESASVPEPRVTTTTEEVAQPIGDPADPGLLRRVGALRLERRAPISFCGALAFLGWRGMGGNATVSVWMKRAGWAEPRRLFRLPLHHYIQQLAFSPDGRSLAVLAMRYDRSVDENARDIFLVRA